VSLGENIATFFRGEGWDTFLTHAVIEKSLAIAEMAAQCCTIPFFVSLLRMKVPLFNALSLRILVISFQEYCHNSYTAES